MDRAKQQQFPKYYERVTPLSSQKRQKRNSRVPSGVSRTAEKKSVARVKSRQIAGDAAAALHSASKQD